MASDADRYESYAPGLDISDAQKGERMQRVDFCREARTLRRTSRTRGIVVPWLPASMTKPETEEG